MPLETGFILNNRYRIVSLLGQGGFGAVYRAWDLSLNRPCAIKENLETTPEAQRQFNREAVILANLNHTNLPRVTDYFSLPDQGQYLVMDFVEGEDLEHYVARQGHVPPEQAMVWIAQVADALDYLHRQDPPVLHRDIKPANVRITPQGKAMLVDFGLVKIYDPALRTTMGARAVTPGFAPPEQYGMGNTDPRSDIYALGATFYALLTGRAPIESVQRMAGMEMTPLQAINPQVSPAVGQAINHAMALTPSKRYSSAGEFVQAFRQPQVGPKPTLIMPVETAAAPYMTGAPDGFAVQDVAVQPAGRTGSKTWLFLGIGVVACLCLALVGGGLGVRSLVKQSDSATSTAKILLAWTGATQTSMATAIQGASAATSTARSAATLDASISATTAARDTEIAISIQATQTNRTIRPTLPVPATLADPSVLFGPQDGSLTHDTSKNYIKTSEAGLNVQDFVAQARFYNPYSRDTGTWDYGFIFRETDAGQYRLVVRSSRRWTLLYKVGTSQSTQLREGVVANLNVDTNGSNVIKLTSQGKSGSFSVNDQQISQLDLSRWMKPGDVWVGTGFYENNEVNGNATRFEGFTVWPSP